MRAAKKKCIPAVVVSQEAAVASCKNGAAELASDSRGKCGAMENRVKEAGYNRANAMIFVTCDSKGPRDGIPGHADVAEWVYDDADCERPCISTALARSFSVQRGRVAKVMLSLPGFPRIVPLVEAAVVLGTSVSLPGTSLYNTPWQNKDDTYSRIVIPFFP